jgi:hypothetical protein
MIIDENDPRRSEAATDGPPGSVERIPLCGDRVLELAMLPLSAADQADTGAVGGGSLSSRAERWIAEGAVDRTPTLVLPLFGTLTVWSPTRAFVAGPDERLEQLRASVVEFTSLFAELDDIERRLAAALPHVDDDAALAADFTTAALSRRGELSARFREAVSLRRRLALLTPPLHVPAPQPPTLAGQLGERLRERTRIVERAGFAVEQAELLERVYAVCADRTSEHAIARRQAALEWTIIVLLAAEVVLLVVDALANRTT